MPFIEEEKAASGDAGKPKGTIVMATVKGDVHDIGKNIVGVVLQCNNFDVIDLGRHGAGAEDPRRRRVEHNADIVGLSGLITPSLEEMAHVAHEMQRVGMTQPLLIGGATTSRVHTAVKIAPHYAGVDRVRAGRVARRRRGEQPAVRRAARAALRGRSRRRLREDPRAARERRKARQLISLAAARANAFATDWTRYAPPVPTLLGRREFRNVDLAEIAQLIDWGPFFQAWELAGPFPAILDDPVVGEAARTVHRRRPGDAARTSSTGRWLTANGVIGVLAGERRAATTSSSAPTSARRRRARPGTTCASRTSGRRASRTTASPISSRPRPAVRATTSARSP